MFPNNKIMFPISSSGLESFVNVNILVIDINDNKPELSIEEIFVCENDMAGTVGFFLELDVI